MTMAPVEKKAVTMRLSAEARRLAELLAVEFGVSKTGAVEMALREMAERNDLRKRRREVD